MKKKIIVCQVDILKKGEELRHAMKREAKEEIGIDINVEDLILYKVLNRKVGKEEYLDFIFKAINWSGSIINAEEEEKCEELKFADKNNLPNNTINFIKEIVKPNDSTYLPYNWREE